MSPAIGEGSQSVLDDEQDKRHPRPPPIFLTVPAFPEERQIPDQKRQDGQEKPPSFLQQLLSKPTRLLTDRPGGQNSGDQSERTEANGMTSKDAVRRLDIRFPGIIG